MNKIVVILLLAITVFVSCTEEPPYGKPENLIKEKQMINMLVDLHIAESTFHYMRNDSLMKNVTSTDYYYSVLNKYNVTDSVFEQSFVYYASSPKNFEKMYRKVMDILSQKEQEFSGRKNELLEFEGSLKK